MAEPDVTKPFVPSPADSPSANAPDDPTLTSRAGDRTHSGNESAPSHQNQTPSAAGMPLGKIGPYELLAKIGEGGMGAVYKARHPKLKKIVALKVLPASAMRDRAAVARFEREMEAVGKLDHPGIVRALDAGEHDGVNYLVMEYVEGQDLQKLLKDRGKLPIAEACGLVRQAAVALAHAHENGLVHRDIKPSNLLLTRQGQLKILDLGLARLGTADSDEGLTSTGVSLGTPDFMSPEQWADTHHVDGRCDIYALGCTLFALLVGHAPYADGKHKSVVSKMTAHVHEAIPSVRSLRPEIPAALDDLCRQLLAKRPEERPANAAELVRRLEPFCQAAEIAPTSEFVVPVPAGPASIVIHPKATSRQPAAQRWSPVRMLLIAAGCGVTALAMLLGAIFVLQTADGTVRIEIDDPEIKVAFDNDGKATFTGADKHKIILQPGKHGFTITRGDLTFGTTSFELKKGEKPVLRIEYLDGKVQVTKDGASLPVAPIPAVVQTGWHGWPADAPPPAIAPFDAEQAREHQEAWAKYLGVRVEWENSIGMKFVLVPPGEFLMGSTSAEIDGALTFAGKVADWTEQAIAEGPQHKVVLTQPCYMSACEVTQQQYEVVIGKNPAGFAPTGPADFATKVAGMATLKHPVEHVSWNDAVDYCVKLSQRDSLRPGYLRNAGAVRIVDGNGYRLPTEAQWEFACRAGTTTKYWTGDDDDTLRQAAWAGLGTSGHTHPVGQLAVNPFGLFDVHGNVWEWAQDGWDKNSYAPFADSVAIDPRGTSLSTSSHIMRGGEWYYARSHCRSSRRAQQDAGVRSISIGFRVTLTVEAVKEALQSKGSRPNAPPRTNRPSWPADAPLPAIVPFDADQAKEHQEAWAKHLELPVEFINAQGMKLRLIPPGEFQMGTADDELKEIVSKYPQAQWESPQHRVVLRTPFYLGVHEVTQRDYQAVVGVNPSHFSRAGSNPFLVAKTVGQDTYRHPVDNVSWLDAVAFCRRLSANESLAPAYTNQGQSVAEATATGYRLPTEAEWEFACRAGTLTKYWTGDAGSSLADAEWIATTAEGRTHAVGQRRANPFGLYDMHGNLAEWVEDAYPYSYGERSGQLVVTRRTPLSLKSGRVVRGGCWGLSEDWARSAARLGSSRDLHGTNWTIRVALPIEAVRELLKSRTTTPPASADLATADQSAAPPAAVIPFNAEKAGQHRETWAKYLELPLEITNSLGTRFVFIPATDRTEPFYLAATETTQIEFASVIKTNPSALAKTGTDAALVAGLDTTKFPVENLTFEEAQDFCERLSQKDEEKNHRRLYRLPTAHEWFVACSAGSADEYHMGKSISLRQANFHPVPPEPGAQPLGRPATVGSYAANAFGLFDMHGNVSEFCSNDRLLRGASWDHPADKLGSAVTFTFPTGSRSRYDGFRAALSIDSPCARLLASPRETK